MSVGKEAQSLYINGENVNMDSHCAANPGAPQKIKLRDKCNPVTSFLGI